MKCAPKWWRIGVPSFFTYKNRCAWDTVCQLFCFVFWCEKFPILNFPYCLEKIVTYFKNCSPADNNCDANGEDIEAENTEHDDDKQEGEADSGKWEIIKITFYWSCHHNISHRDNRRICNICNMTFSNQKKNTYIIDKYASPCREMPYRLYLCTGITVFLLTHCTCLHLRALPNKTNRQKRGNLHVSCVWNHLF